MDELIEVNKILKIRAKKNLKWQILVALVAIIWCMPLLYLDLSLVIQNKMSIEIFRDLVLISFLYILLIFSTRNIFRIRKTIKLSFQRNIVHLHDINEINKISQINDWTKNKALRIMKHIFYPSSQKPYFFWGVLELKTTYYMVFIDFYKNNQLIVCEIDKEQLNQCPEKDKIEKTITKAKIRAEKYNKPLFSYLHVSFIFYIKN